MKRNLLSKKILAASLIGGTIAGGGILSNLETAYAHGFIINDRAHLAQQGINNAGRASQEPQSVGEYTSSNFHSGSTPLHQAITSHGNSTTSSMAYPLMADQSVDRWHKIDMNGGENDITWQITANHRAMYIDYYITKPNWDPNQPLTLESFEKLERVVYHEGSDFWNAPLLPVDGNRQVTHTINLPTDRSGYHVIFAEWYVADTGSSFFKVKDINLNNGPVEIIAPSAPQNLQSGEVTESSIELSWSRPAGVVDYYNIYRVGTDLPIGRSTTESFTDTDLNINTEYEYFVVAVNEAGTSPESERLRVRTAAHVTPGAPTNLREQGITSDSITLAWDAPNSGADEYIIYRLDYNQRSSEREIGRTSATSFTDEGLIQDVNYKYYVVSVKGGVVSAPSIELVSIIPSELFPPEEVESDLVDRAPIITSIDATEDTITFDFHRSTSLNANNGEVMYYTILVDNELYINILPETVGLVTLTSNQNLTITENTSYNVKVIARYVPKVGDTILIEGLPSRVTTESTQVVDDIPEFVNTPGLSFVAGQRVRHQGNIYEARQNFTLNGDPSWAPGSAAALWILVS